MIAPGRHLIQPYGDQLINLVASAVRLEELNSYAKRLPCVQLSERAVCDLELLATGAFSPLDRFMARGDYERVLYEMRLSSGHLFPIPITLPVEADAAIRLDRDITLRNSRNELLAVMTIAITPTSATTEPIRM